MNQENIYAKDIAIIAERISDHFNIRGIWFDQVLMNEKYRETGVNNTVFIRKAYGLYFYTYKTAMEAATELKMGCELPILVGHADSLNLYRIK